VFAAAVRASAEAGHRLHLAQRLPALALGLQLAFGALHRVLRAVQPGDHLEHLAEAAAAEHAQIHKVGAQARHRGKRGGARAVRARVRRRFLRLVALAQKRVAQTRRGLRGAGQRRPPAGGRARRRNAEHRVVAAAAVFAARVSAVLGEALRRPSPVRGLRPEPHPRVL
jgi:hypothetical protein